MKYYAIHDGITGKVIQVAGTQDDFNLPSIEVNAIEIADKKDPDRIYFDGTAITDIPASPGTAYLWDWTSKSWVLDMTTGKASAWARIKASRDMALQGPFIWNGHLFDGDTAAQTRVQGAVQMATLALQAGQAYSVDWTLADNTTVTLSAADMIAVGQAMGAQYQANFAKGQALRLQVESATTQAALDAIVW